jgi:hypothetical protein
LSLFQPSQMTYSDTDIQQLVGYTAFDQLLMDLDGYEPSSRVYRKDLCSDLDGFFMDRMLETSELRDQHGITKPHILLPSSPELSMLYKGDVFSITITVLLNIS